MWSLPGLQNNISSIAFRVYEPPSDSQSFGSVAIDIENTLREQGRIVYYDAARRGIWHFRIVGKEGSESVTAGDLEPTISLRGHTLSISEEGSFEPSSLQRPRLYTQQSGHTPTSSTTTAALDQSQRQTVTANSQTTNTNAQEQDAKATPALVPGLENKPGQAPGATHKAIYENFIAATLLTLSSTFCSRSHALPLNYRTVLLSDGSAGNDELNKLSDDKTPTIGTFKAYLTTTGALVVSLGFSICRGLLSSDEDSQSGPMPPGQRILAAPFGVIANKQLSASFDGGTASMAQTPNTQALSVRGVPDVHDSLWKQACLRVLQLRGIARSKLNDCFWVNLSVSKPRLQDAAKRQQAPNATISIPWPGPLCFRKKIVEISSTSRVGDTILSGHEESHDPLGNAQAWFAAAAERDEKVSKRKGERATVFQDVNNADIRQSRTNGQSPVALRRPSTAAAGAMYPTPPDALHNLNGVTPSLDGTLSSPGNPLSVAPVPEADNAAPNSVTAEETFDSGPDTSEAKGQRSDGNLLVEAEHMFGDMGGDMFGDNDITEADFNFFDEQPDDLGLDVSMGDIAEPNHTVTTNDNNATAAVDTAEVESLTPTGNNAVKQDPEAEKDHAVFTKPELRHAISARNDGLIQKERESRSVPMKRESSPFDPHTVFKRVKASLAATKGTGTSLSDENRTTKIFEKMDFEPTLPMINKKYEHGGQFDFSTSPNKGKPKLEPGTLPETDYLKRRSKQIKGLRLHTSSLMGQMPGLDIGSADPSPTKLENQLSDGDHSSAESDQDDSSYTSDEPTSPLKSSVKQTVADDDAASQVTSLKEMDPVEEPDHQLAIELPRLAKPEPPEQPLSVLFSDPEPLSLESSLSDDDLIQVAQILTEQAATGTLDLFRMANEAKSCSITGQDRQNMLSEARSSLHLLREVAPLFLRGVESARLKGYLDIPDVPLQGQPNRLQPRAIPGREGNTEPLRPSNLYQIPGPHLEVRRSDAKLSVLPSAVTFWESLGLAPSSGSKDVTAVCVFPGWKGMVDNATTFLSRVKSVYEVLRLGSLEKLTLSTEAADGILAYEVDRISTSPDATMTGHGSALIGSMETLRTALSNVTVVDKNIVVYFVYSPNNPGTIVEACAAFQRFFEMYQKDLATRKETATNELVLQLVSTDILSSPTSLVVTRTPDLVKLCMETYDRCTLFGGLMPAPAIRLEQPLPRIIDFKLTNSPSASLIRENSCIHVAYAQTVDERWITAAWTDDRGNQQATSSYCLGRKGRPQSLPMNEVAHEIWESTLDLISVWKVHWRVIITKCGPMDQSEVEFWVDLARTEIKASVTMILMTVDTNPSLQLIPPVVKLPQTTVPFYTTPVSTPQASIVSPEQSATPATPAYATAATPTGAGGDSGGGDSETDAVLSDLTDQTWGAIVGHRLSNSLTVMELRPTLASGYLIKRTGPRAEDTPVAMEVNLVHTDASPRAYEPLLREMLSYFRGLATLARARGVVARDIDARPWHVAAAEKAARAMYLLM